MKYKISELSEARRVFSAMFGIALGEVTDNLLTALSGHIVVDVVLFDEVFRRRYDCDDNASLNGIVLQRFGQEGLDVLDEFLELIIT